jgi:hypothetical protein
MRGERGGGMGGGEKRGGDGRWGGGMGIGEMYSPSKKDINNYHVS